jgi:hypothetical protein
MTGEPFETDLIVHSAKIEEIASEVALILSKRISNKDLLRLLQIIFLDVDETAELLRVKPKTISTWISQDRIPVRYAGGRPVFFCLSFSIGLCLTMILIHNIDSHPLPVVK